MTIPYGKISLNLDQQLDLLAARGLLIEDRVTARRFLERVNYYRLSAYIHPFRVAGGDSYPSDITFSRVVWFYEFDRRLRLFVLDAIERIEVAVRTLMINVFSQKHGTFGHMDPQNFEGFFKHREWLAKLDEEVGRSKETFISHYRQKYDGHPTVPLWMAIEIMQFGSLTMLYKGSKTLVRDQVARHLGVHEKVMGSWLLSIGYVRNLCAHHCRLWNRELSIAPLVPERDRRWKSPILMWRDRTFSAILVIRSMLRSLQIGMDWSARMESEFKTDFQDAFVAKGLGLAGTWTDHPVWSG